MDDVTAVPSPIDDGSVPFLTLAQMEAAHLEAALRRAAYNGAVAAKLLGLSRWAFYRHLQKHGIPWTPRRRGGRR